MPCYNSGTMQERKTRKNIANLILIITGTFMLCLSVEAFILPYNILSGGVAGIAVALYPVFHINTTLLANLLTVVLLGLGGVSLGKKFFFSTALSSLLYPLFNELLARTLFVPETEPLLASFYGGLLGGIGVGMVMRAGASTGGMDIPPLIIHKFTGIKVSTLVEVVDTLTVLLGVFTYGIPAALVGLISVFSTSWAIGRVLSFGAGQSSKSVQIISDKWQEIASDITTELNRSATILNATGAYSGEEKKMLIAAVSSRQYSRLLEIIERHDKKAFVITTDATDMHGEGFTYYGAHI